MGKKTGKKRKISAREQFAISGLRDLSDKREDDAQVVMQSEFADVDDLVSKKKTKKQKVAKKVKVPVDHIQEVRDYLARFEGGALTFKFSKKHQTFLLRHMFDNQVIEDSQFGVLIKYVEGMQGRSRDTTLETAKALVQDLKAKVNDNNKDDKGDANADSDEETVRKEQDKIRLARAMKVAKALG
eukprot:c12924_g2_i1.p1 GENE.c12924_g2_i1~~c12924_g2_i1.p1  ORF type:complete len:185 (-),score=57.67 c12924_g2_i1:88-642(-)